MYAKNLEIALASLMRNSDGGSAVDEEFELRFQSLRDYGHLPRRRTRRAQTLTTNEIAAALLGAVPANPRWAGHVATVLSDLRPVGGSGGSFCGADTLLHTISRILSDKVARERLISLTLSTAESGTNVNGYATLLHEVGDTGRKVSFVSKMAVSLLQPGAERDFEHDRSSAMVSRQLALSGRFFRRLAFEISRAEFDPAPPAGDGEEYDAEEAREERNKRLGVRPSSTFLNLRVNAQVPWPRQEILVKFDRYKLVLLPRTADNSQSIHVDLANNRLTDVEAITLINRFLSVLTWCDDQSSMTHEGWSGSPVPGPMSTNDPSFRVTGQWLFDRSVPSSEEAKRALAIYREARNAQQAGLISYTVLNFYKIIELKYHGKENVKNWFRDNLGILEKEGYTEELASFRSLCGNERPHEYIQRACRVAVAHAGKDSRSDPDDLDEVRRLHTAADVLRILARHFIRTELLISDNPLSAD